MWSQVLTRRRLVASAIATAAVAAMMINVRDASADVPMKRPAQPEEIAPAFVFLASPQCSSYITGEILPVIGGYGD